MKIISHRGNIQGPDPLTENTVAKIEEALSLGFDVEIDLWVIGTDLFLGHDSPDHAIDKSFIDNSCLWVHAKNLQALDFLVNEKLKSSFFWHESDCYTLTSQNHIWAYPHQSVTENTVIVVTNENMDKQVDCVYEKSFGICTDYPVYVKEKWNLS
jgi:hypothetical protein